MHQCPACTSHNIHRSPSRSLIERIRKRLSRRRPHRCHACGWRGWGPPTGGGHAEHWVMGDGTPDFDALDETLRPAQARPPREVATREAKS